MEQRTVTLHRCNSKINPPGTTAFRIESPPDYVNYVEDDLFWIDLYAEILDGYGVLLVLETSVKTLPKQRKFLPDRPLTYHDNPRVADIKQHISTHNPPWQWFEEVIPQKFCEKLYPMKVCFVYATSPDKQMLTINYQEDTPEFWCYGLAPEQCSDDFKSFARSVYADQTQPIVTIANGEIWILEDLYSADKLEDNVRRIAEKHSRIYCSLSL